MICEPWDLVVVPFPFSEQLGSKRRPALVLSSRDFNEAGHVILAMVTSRSHTPWPGDSPLSDWKGAGLSVPCMVRLKLFTLDHRLVLRRLGALSSKDRKDVSGSFRVFLRL